MTTLTKDSGIDWIGDIPKHWEVLRLKSIYNYKNGYAFSDNDYSKEPNGNYLIKITNVTENGIQEDETFCIEVNEITKKFKIKEDSILYALSGATAGKCCFLDKTEKNFYLNQRVAQMQLKNGINKYFYYLICNKVFANLLLTLYPQTAQPNIGKNDLDNSYVPFISDLIEQQKIVTYLDTKTSKIDRKISILEQKFAKLEEYKQSVIFETVTKGLGNNVEMKDSGIDWIGEIPKHWEVLRLKSIYNYKNGYAFSDNDYSKEPNGNYLIKITNVTENGIQEDETFCIELNDITKKFKIKEDSILYALSGATAGKCCFLEKTEKNFYLNQRVAQMQLKNGINKYFYYLICNKVFANLLLTLYPQTAQPNIGKNDLDNSYVPFISNLIEQKEIVAYLDNFTSKVDKKKEIIKKQIELLKEYKQTIIYEAVTGKTEIL